MSEYKVASTGKLSFKGDKSSNRLKLHLENMLTIYVKLFFKNINKLFCIAGWVPVETPEDLVGPLFFIFNSEPLSCLFCSEKDYSIGVRPLLDKQLPTCEPDEVSFVLVGSRIAGATDTISLKTFNGKYLASDKFGAITAEREAIGPQEEWRPIIKNDGIALQNSYDKFLSVDEIADGGYKLRADVETIGFCETWHVKCQARFRKKLKSTKKESKPISEFEIEQIKKYQTWGGGRIKTTKDDISELRKAKKEGNFSEALLDRREKVKADRYCK
ncbi:9322_t:CDS:2 [Gigaspora margarita]|uniref:9322_t:CDS:1 n=1 Tax=Gigaspora margarita TaxID=4874 RepID=A0ABN7VK12_GIGMA|nr:9322_t:CDS:2 [Gigaspora margarita]